jgi:mono/diheme cytochrome c family protein
MTSRCFPLLLAIGGVVFLAASAPSLSGQARPQRPSLVIPTLYGGDLFQFYCASCHGREGKGDGPVASALNHQPADLTTIAKRNDGRFPREAVERFISGEAETLGTSAHGSRDMPVWGPILYALDPDEHLTRVRLSNVVSYIESIQTK